AIGLSNTDTAPSTIVFDAAAFSGTKTIALTGEIPITAGITITGPAGGLVLDPASRIFNIDPTTAGDAVSISNMTLDSGNATGNGGGILNVDAALTLTNVTISNCTASGSGGGISVSTATGSVTLA